MEPTIRRRCSHIDVLYGPCTLPARHADDCLHEDQPRCRNTSPHDGHVCVLERHHGDLHADKPLAEITPDGSRMVWRHATETADAPAP